MKLETFQIRDRHGWRPVVGRRLSAAFAWTAEVLEDREPDDTTTVFGKPANVTHLPTGLFVFDDVRKLGDAKKLVAALEALEGVDWLESDPTKLAEATQRVAGIDPNDWRKTLRDTTLAKPEPDPDTIKAWMRKLDARDEWKGSTLEGFDWLTLAETSGDCDDKDCRKKHENIKVTRKGKEHFESRHLTRTKVLVVKHPEGAILKLRYTKPIT